MKHALNLNFYSVIFFSLLMGVFSSCATSQNVRGYCEYNNVGYVLCPKDSTAKVLGYGTSSEPTDSVSKSQSLIIPPYLEMDSITYTVTSFGKIEVPTTDSIHTVVLPHTIQHISAEAFYGFKNLDTVKCNSALMPQLKKNMFKLSKAATIIPNPDSAQTSSSETVHIITYNPVLVRNAYTYTNGDRTMNYRETYDFLQERCPEAAVLFKKQNTIRSVCWGLLGVGAATAFTGCGVMLKDKKIGLTTWGCGMGVMLVDLFVALHANKILGKSLRLFNNQEKEKAQVNLSVGTNGVGFVVKW